MTGFDRARIEAAVAEILAAIGEDPSRPGLASTPSRVADAYAEFFAGVGVDASAELGEPVPLETARAETVIVRDIAFRSVCEHHLLPFLGVAHVAYLPGEAVVGLGRIPRVIDALAARPQIQERLTEQIADAIEQGAGAQGVLVVLDASHACVTTRGSRQTESTTVTVAARGAYTEPAARAELMALIGSGVS
ncbi:GTP cyclohydrolase 1 [Leifsonia sp. LS1]|uniref:GTP cyclohydrolase I FolE n=1 Tax=Leifsonia sp. LS1 TaxID=2828483 RepID=UPI001CFD6E3B|nr:GTP cyclohydrolase I FolE [Leifsonia sp. LS1]GIT79754.1 GTP cyclohydrolase 1 [Leifsonia sp. LS1]